MSRKDRNKPNTSAELARGDGRPSLLLHSCCAPCSSYVLEHLSATFDITVFYYNPNIQPAEEYFKRRDEQIRFLNMTAAENGAGFIEGEYRPESFLAAATGLEAEKEGRLRCRVCFELRLRQTALVAKAQGFDLFATTLSVSPHKNAALINKIGEAISREIGVDYLESDFKKKDGYKRSIELSKKYGLYRQNYCGCVFSRRGKA